MRNQKKRHRHQLCRCGTGIYCAYHGQYQASPGLAIVKGVELSEPSRYGEDDQIAVATFREPHEHQQSGGGVRIIRKQIGGP
jgi:hypothetical protein